MGRRFDVASAGPDTAGCCTHSSAVKVHWLMHALTSSLTHSLMHSRTYAPNHSRTHARTLMHPNTDSRTLLMHLITHSPKHSPNHADGASTHAGEEPVVAPEFPLEWANCELQLPKCFAIVVKLGTRAFPQHQTHEWEGMVTISH